MSTIPHQWSFGPIILTTIAVLITYRVLRALYNIYLHPLSNVPGPYAWSASRLPFVISLLRGTIVHDIQKYHKVYGPILRTAPDEVTFARADAWSDILQARSDQFLKDPVRWAKQPENPESLISAIDPASHARMRSSLAPAFTLRALKSQEPILHQYVNLLVDRLTQLTSGSSLDRKTEIDIGPWFNYVTFDIFGDLGFGESFDCLQNSRYHPWIALLFNSVKTASFVSSARFYPFLEFLLLKLVPPSLRKTQRDHYQQIADKVERRLNLELERPDIMSYVMTGDGDKGLSRDEIDATLMMLTTAGSETTATVLGGTLNYLVTHPDKLKILSEEIRQGFTAFENITLDALSSLPYLNAVINEGLRLCPPISWILPRKVPAHGAIVCGSWLPGGTSVTVQVYTLNRDHESFHSATSFLPERWLSNEISDPKSSFYNDQRDAFQPFSVGPWSCLGQHLTRAELRLVLAKLIWKFDFGAGNGKVLEWEKLRTFLLVEKKPITVSMVLREGLQAVR